jgi:hypothetical protein
MGPVSFKRVSAIPRAGQPQEPLNLPGFDRACPDVRSAACHPRQFDFFFDGGCYHAVRLENPDGYFAALDHLLRPGALGLVLLGNDREPEAAEGPPGVREATIRREFGALFDVLRLREFRFDAPPGGRCYLGWSCLLARRRDD